MLYRFHLAMNEKMAERNREIFYLASRGHSGAAIGRLLNLSGSRVCAILRNGEAFSTSMLAEANA